MSGREFEWPKPGQQLNPPVEHWPARAILHTEYKGRSNAMIAWGYRTTAELIFEDIASGRGAIDVLAGPLVFNWRHHVEVHLKANLEYMWRAADVPLKHNLDHGLMNLWAEQVRAHAHFGLELSNSDLEAGRAARGLLAQLDQLDPSSFHFRYSVNRKGKELQVPAELNIVAFHRGMLALSNYLSAVIDHLDAALEPQREFEAEMRAEFLADMREAFGP